MFHFTLSDGRVAPIEYGTLRFDGVDMECFGQFKLTSENQLTLGNQLTLHLDKSKHTLYVIDQQYLGKVLDRHIYEIEIGSQLTPFKKSQHSRVFTNTKLSNILEEVLPNIQIHFHDTPPPAKLLIQFQQTDFDFFISTLIHFGLHYFYENDTVHIFKNPPKRKNITLELKPFNTGFHDSSCAFNLEQHTNHTQLETTEPNIKPLQIITLNNQTITPQCIHHSINSINEKCRYSNSISSKPATLANKPHNNLTLTAKSENNNKLSFGFSPNKTTEAMVLSPGLIQFAAEKNQSLACSFIENDLSKPVILGAINTNQTKVTNKNSQQNIIQSNQNVRIVFDDQHPSIKLNSPTSHIKLEPKHILFHSEHDIKISNQTHTQHSLKKINYKANTIETQATEARYKTKTFKIKTKLNLTAECQQTKIQCTSFNMKSKDNTQLRFTSTQILAKQINIKASQGLINTQKQYQLKLKHLKLTCEDSQISASESQIKLQATNIDLKAESIIMSQNTQLD